MQIIIRIIIHLTIVMTAVAIYNHIEQSLLLKNIRGCEKC